MNLIDRAIVVVLIATATTIATASTAQARLGESIQAFKIKAEHSYKLQKEIKKDDRTYDSFTMIVDDKLKESAPGFAVGETLTVVDGKIVGQSMVIRIGDNVEGGKALATIHAMDFTYESIGKAPPKKAIAEQEFKEFQSAINAVLVGSPQHIQYPGFKAHITLSRSTEGELLLAATPDFSESSEAKPKAKAH